MAGAGTTERRDYRFARSPRWIATHAFALVLVVVMINLGFWQLRRLDERQARNDLVLEQRALPAVPVDALVGPDADAGDLEAVRFRHATAGGSYLQDPAASVRAPGGYVVTLLDLGGGRSLPVLRGSAVELVAPPQGAVEVEGFLIPRDRLDHATRTAAERLEVGAGGTSVLPVVLQAGTADAPELVAVEPPDLGAGPHLAYAVQWFVFSAVGIVGYPFFLRRRAGERE